MNSRALLVGLALTTSLASCSSSGRLSDSEIDRACALAARCSGTGVTACTRATVDARALADNNGCVDIFARTNRCYLSEDTCSVSARCQVLSDELIACGVASVPPDAGMPDANLGSCPTGVATITYEPLEGTCTGSTSDHLFVDGVMHFVNGTRVDCDYCSSDSCTLSTPSQPSCSYRLSASACGPDRQSHIREYTITDGLVAGTVREGTCLRRFSGRIRR